MTDPVAPIWTAAWIRTHPVRFVGICLHLGFRTLFGIFWLAAGINKFQKQWHTTDILREIFLDRLTQLPPDSFAVWYLQNFAIPLYKPVAWVIGVGEVYAAVGLLLGLTTRWAAGMSLFILINLAIGGYYDASLIPFFILNTVFLRWQSGHWLGFDRLLVQRYPQSLWFR
ncbi:MAG: DoxX family membrane protein [Gammaproteobacteria bacterium]|nr:DoxX family membrane protein [Gammaproteobacteria bacterium]